MFSDRMSASKEKWRRMKKFFWPWLAVMMLTPSWGWADAQDATLLQILSDPRKHDRDRVRVVGYLYLERDENAIYLHEDDFKHALFGNSLALEITDDMLNRREQLSGNYVVIEGIFDAQHRGPFQVHSGTIKKIRRCEIWSSDAMPANRARLKKEFKKSTND